MYRLKLIGILSIVGAKMYTNQKSFNMQMTYVEVNQWQENYTYSKVNKSIHVWNIRICATYYLRVL